MTAYREFYRERPVLITGGLGFIGSNLARQLAARSPDRDALQAHLGASGIDTLIHYPVPLPGQPEFAGIARGTCPVAARAAGEILSLPLHPRLTDADVARVAAAVGAFQKGRILA